MMISVLRPVEMGSTPLGAGPQRFGHPRRHHTTEPMNQKADDTAVAANARCLHRELDAVATATAASIGKYAGNVARHCPTLVATPLPPANPVQTG